MLPGRQQDLAKAAEHCNVSRPALTRAIQKMENEFGQLFSREHGDTQLTALGRLLQPQFAQMLDLKQRRKR